SQKILLAIERSLLTWLKMRQQLWGSPHINSIGMQALFYKCGERMHLGPLLSRDAPFVFAVANVAALARSLGGRPTRARLAGEYVAKPLRTQVLAPKEEAFAKARGIVDRHLLGR